MTKIDKITKRLLFYMSAALIVWSIYVCCYAYHIQLNAQNFGLEVNCADQSEACSDAVEDLNQGVM